MIPILYLLKWVFLNFGASICKHRAFLLLKDDEYNTKVTGNVVLLLFCFVLFFVKVNSVQFADFLE